MANFSHITQFGKFDNIPILGDTFLYERQDNDGEKATTYSTPMAQRARVVCTILPTCIFSGLNLPESNAHK